LLSKWTQQEESDKKIFFMSKKEESDDIWGHSKILFCTFTPYLLFSLIMVRGKTLLHIRPFGASFVLPHWSLSLFSVIRLCMIDGEAASESQSLFIFHNRIMYERWRSGIGT
jgi:hypothetical protein